MGHLTPKDFEYNLLRDYVVEALSIDKEIVSKGDKAVKAFLVKEYGIFL